MVRLLFLMTITTVLFWSRGGLKSIEATPDRIFSS
jgi:hypothetical protein